MRTYDNPARISSPHTPCRRRSDDRPDHSNELAHDDFAKRLTLSVLGHRHAWALDQPDFCDRQPDQPRMSANGRALP